MTVDGRGLGLMRVGRAEAPRVAALLAHAFHDDPLMRYAIPDARQRRVLPRLIALNVRYVCRYGEVYATPGFEGAALWLPPRRTTPTLGRMLRAGMAAAPFTVPWPVLWRLAAVESHAQALHTRYAPEPHWYLAQIGVEPAQQRQGVASRLLRSMLAHCDAQALPCYLETEHEANIAFYKRFGFRIVAEDANLPSGLHIWAMLRAPSASATRGR